MAFYRLTPRQWKLLDRRHKDALAHREMVAAHTTAAVLNWRFWRNREEPAKVTDFMPNYRKPEIAAPDKSPEQMQAESDFNVRIAELAEQMRVGAGPLYEEICLGKKPKAKRSKSAQR